MTRRDEMDAGFEGHLHLSENEAATWLAKDSRKAVISD
jgi:hypothetical protein